jgi:uncharacterized protein (TIGR01319 family)
MATQVASLNLQSVISADFGSVNTRVILVDVVDGQYRLLAQTQTPTTIGTPINDVTVCLGRAVEDIQNKTGRVLVDESGLIFPEQTDGSGVDELIATTSAARPLRAVLIGLMPDMSMETAHKALSGTYVHVVATLSSNDNKNEEEQLNTILRAQPDLIFIAGGTDGGDEQVMQQLIRLVQMSLHLFPQNNLPIVLYAGNQALARFAYENLYIPELDNDVFIAPNIRPDLDTEAVSITRLELSIAYNNFVERQPGGFRDISMVSKAGVIPTSQSVGTMLRWLSELGLDGPGILHVDVGSTSSSLVVAIDKEVSSTVRSDMGIGHSIVSALSMLDTKRVLEWLPFSYTLAQLENYAQNKALKPDTIPQTTQDMIIEYAIAREIIRHLVLQEQKTWKGMVTASGTALLPAFQPIIVAGATLTGTAHPGISVMLVVDALGLEGISEIYGDAFALLPALGAVALLEPTVTVQVFENQSLSNYGPVFCASGRPSQRGNRPAMRIKIQLETGRVIEHNLMGGEIWCAPISPGQSAQVDIRLGRGLRINGKSHIRQKVRAGLAGISFDARGRPLPVLPLPQRPEMYNKWWTGVSGHALAGWEKWVNTSETSSPLTPADSSEVETLLQLIDTRYASEDENEGGRLR